jgi:signal transduction histidine kinase
VTTIEAEEITHDEVVRELRRTIVTQRNALAEAEAARQDAEAAADARGTFLAKMSHELRTPLNAILGFSEVLKTELFGPHGNERYKDYSKIIHDSGTHLLCLVNDILDMAKLEAGKLEIDFAPVDICRVIIDCVRGVEPQARRAQVGVSVVLHSGVGRLNGDARRLRQMLLNLLSNAIKFTPEGGEVRISAFRSGTSVFLSVSDTGIGMKEDDIPKVLEPFRQIDSQLARRHQGTGLGLPLTKELAELHGGSLTIESAVDLGTTATISLPFENEGARRAA